MQATPTGKRLRKTDGGVPTRAWQQKSAHAGCRLIDWLMAMDWLQMRALLRAPVQLRIPKTVTMESCQFLPN